MRKIAPSSRAAVAGMAIWLLCVSCGEQSEDLSLTNPGWRSAVPTEIEFPLPELITLTVGLPQQMQGMDTESTRWLEEQTNIHLEYVVFQSSPGDVVLGEMIREGRLPDILPEGRVGMGDASIRALFVDFLEFPDLTPHFNALLKSNIDFRNSILSKTTVDNQLFSLNTYDPDKILFDGILAYRRDIFEKHDLSTKTWEDIADSLKFLKSEYPDKYPFGGTFDTLIYHMPGWFGSGLDPDHIVYFDVDTRRWVLGPFEPEFKTAVEYLVDLVQNQLVSLDLFTAKDEDVGRLFLNDAIMLAPYSQPTGPSFRFKADDYGELDDDGEWNGEGRWIDALELPPAPDGSSRPYLTGFKSVAGKGWSIYNQSDHVAEAIALLDLLFSPETAISIALGPEGNAWSRNGETIALEEKYLTAYMGGGTRPLSSAMEEDGFTTGSILSGLAFSYHSYLGIPDNPRLRYFLKHDVAMNMPGIDIPLQPGFRIPIHDDFQGDRALAYVSLETTIKSELANFLAGNKPISEYDEFIAKLDKYGAQKLVDLYNKWCTVVDPGILAKNLD